MKEGTNERSMDGGKEVSKEGSKWNKEVIKERRT